MKALVLDAYGSMAVHTVPTPVADADEILIRIRAVGICGSDTHGYTGENGRRSPGQIMGHEAVGVIETANPARRPDLGVGELVTFNPVVGCGHCSACAVGESQRCADKYVIGVAADVPAAMAEFLAVPALNVVSLDRLRTPELGALVEPLAVGEHAVSRARITDADTVWVVGAGPIGQAVTIALLRRGVESVFVSDPSERRRDVVTRLGARAFAPDEVEATFEGRDRPSVVIDAVGASGTISSALRDSAPGATLVLVGMHEQQITLPAYAISTEERSLIGSFCYSTADFEAVATWIQDTDLDLRLLIDDSVPLAAGDHAFRALADGSAGAGKILLVPGGEQR